LGDLTKNFSRSEIACPCGCGFDTIDHETIVHLQYERDYFGKPILITSACRCARYNASPRIGGGKKSQHVRARAVDHWIEGIDVMEQYRYFQERWPNRYGIGVYINKMFLHFDTRSGPAARWSGAGETVKF